MKNNLQAKFTLVMVMVAILSLLSWGKPTLADDKAVVMNEMETYFDFVDYGGGVIFAEQISKDQWPLFLVIDTRDAAQYEKSHIPHAINIEWRQILAQRDKLPKDKPILLYCNTGSLSAQAGFALRVAGWENVKILNGGMNEWHNKGGFDAAEKAAVKAITKENSFEMPGY